jgi:ubiquitin-protein ligase
MRRDMKCTGLSESGIHVIFDESNIMRASAMIIGPKDTPYEDGLLFFSIQFPPDYPFSPPQVYYISTSRHRIHPNLYVGRSHNNFQGKVCLSIINTWSGPKWTSAMDINSILRSIQSLLCNKPITHEPGYEKSPASIIAQYNDIVQYDTFKQLIHRHRNPTGDFAGFKDIIDKHLSAEKDAILQRAELYHQKYPEPVSIGIKLYNISIDIHSKGIVDLLTESLNLI